MEILGWSAWADKYKPVTNHLSKHNELMFETYGEEIEYLQTVDPKYVWTWVDGDLSSFLVAGYAYVNRLGYYVTEVPWESDNDYVLLSVETECECYSEDEDVMATRNDEYGDPKCDKCEGAGYVTEYVTEEN